jgi:hypothetical protein
MEPRLQDPHRLDASRAKLGRPVARSRHELLHQTCAVVLDPAPSWSDGGSAIIVVADPRLTRADVLSAFDEITEKFHVTGIGLRFDEQGGRLRAIFEPCDASGLSPTRSRIQPLALAEKYTTRPRLLHPNRSEAHLTLLADTEGVLLEEGRHTSGMLASGSSSRSTG